MSNRFPLILLIVGLLLYSLLILPFTSYMCNKPIEEKLGYVPSIKLIKPLSADQKELVGASLVMKVLMYYGGAIGNAQQGKIITESPDLQGMSRILHGAVQLDPYNMDAYYFAQGFLTWDARQIKVANDLLDYGIRYRTWDWQLPYFAGFNHAFFLKEYGKAAEYYKKAALMSGSALHVNLAGRYMQESGQTALAVAYLTGMVRTATNQAVRQSYEVRLKAFQTVQQIEDAREQFKQERGVLPASVEQLHQTGYLKVMPLDPYGGRFYLEPTGKVSTTSKFAFATKNK